MQYIAICPFYRSFSMLLCCCFDGCARCAQSTRNPAYTDFMWEYSVEVRLATIRASIPLLGLCRYINSFWHAEIVRRTSSEICSAINKKMRTAIGREISLDGTVVRESVVMGIGEDGYMVYAGLTVSHTAIVAVYSFTDLEIDIEYRLVLNRIVFIY